MNLFMERRAVDIRGYRWRAVKRKSVRRNGSPRFEARRDSEEQRGVRACAKVTAQSVRHAKRGRKLQR